MATEFYWLRAINPASGLRLKQTLMITLQSDAANGTWIARTGALKTAVVAPNKGVMLDLLLATMVSRFYALHLRRLELAPDLYDEWRELSDYLGPTEAKIQQEN